MRKAYFLLVLVGCTLAAAAQKNGSIKGIAFDTISKSGVASATITVLDKKDSSLVTFTMTDNGGRFELRGIPNGDYRLMISHVSYRNSNTNFKISDENKNLDLGNITLNDASKVLDEVVVANEAPPVTMVGDTVQYNAGSFKTAPNASVEQLLKKLPGVTVDKDGTIKAQGEKVTKVLVDGKEFFSNDPKIATRNLPADALDKVQVYDKQSDQAQLTGFEDGNYEKTINLKLKKDKKRGVFGKVSAGAGNKERYEGKFNVNSFKGARQMSAIGMGNNTNAEGFSFMDILSFTGALNQMRQGGGGNISLNVSGEDAAAMGVNTGGNNGINTAWGGGFNYNNLIGNKIDLQSNYFYNRYNPNTQSRIFRQNILPGGVNLYDQESYSDNLNIGHRFNFNVLYQIDSMHSLKLVPSLSFQDTRNRSMTDYRTRAENGTMINEGNSNNLSNSEGYNFKNDLIFRKKFDRRGRTFSFTLSTSLNESEGDGSLNSIINYYTGGIINKRDTLNQRSFSNGDLRGYSVRAIYTEPLWKRTLLEFSAGRSNTLSTSDKTTYDYNRNNGKYDQVNDQLTNDFENTYGYTTAGFRMRKQGRKFNYSLGATWQYSELEGKIISGIKDSIIGKDFRNILPNATFRYNFTRFKYFNLYYNGSTNQPTMSQLQPVPDNSNPLYIKAGNPDLKQEYTHSLRGNLNMLSPTTNRNLFFFFSGSTTKNKIANYDTIDVATGARTTRPINVNGVYNFMTNANYNRPLRFLKGSVEVGVVAMINKNKQFLNGIENRIKTFSLGPTLRLDMFTLGKFNITTEANLQINRTKYSLQTALDNNYLSQEYTGSVDWELPKSFFFSTEFTYTINSQRSSGFNTNVPMWNASISKQFLKYKRGELKLAATDLLNRNTGISRTTNQNYIEDKQVNTLRRFFLLGFTYSLSKTGLNAAGPGSGMKMIMR
jgi:hypothetical protein